MAGVVVGKVSDIPPGHRMIVAPFPGQAGIGVFNVAGTFYAVRNICPHKAGPICAGEIGVRVTAEAPPSTDNCMISVDRSGEILRCPWHQWPFEIETGRCLLDPKVRVKTYPVKIDGDDVIVEC